MKMLAVTRRMKTILILSMLLLAVCGSLAAQSRTKDRVRKRAPRIFAAQTGPDQVTLAWDEVPGTTEYRIYLPNPNKPGPPAPGSRPYTSLSGSGRRAIITGVARMANGAYLEALGEGEGDVLYRGTFNAVTRAPLARPTAPVAVQARETGETELTLSWTPVPGATAYMISRAVDKSGWQMLCDVCPPGGEFVDDTATPGVEHTYSVAAIFPLGISTRTQSKTLTVGATQLEAAAASAPPVVWDKPMSSGTPVAGTDGDNTNVGASGGTPTTGTTTGTTTTGTGTITPTTNPTGWTPGGVSGASGSQANTFTPGGTPAQQLPTTTTQPTGYPPTGMPSGNPGTWTTQVTPGGTPAASMPVQQLPTTTTQPIVYTATPATTNTQTTNNPYLVMVGNIADSLDQRVTQLASTLGLPVVHSATPVTTTTGTQTTNTQGVFTGIAGGVATGGLQPTTISTSTPGTSTPTTSNPIGEILGGIGDALGSIKIPLSPPTGAAANVTGPGMVSVKWQASPATGVTGYRVNRRVNGGAWDVLNTVGTGTLQYSDAFFPITMFASGTARVSYSVVALKSSTVSSASTTGDVVVQPAASSTGAPACRLDYQRADNMWAAFGRPDGPLGTETISLSPAQDKVFITDWKYEKTRNDGSNYYGSHLRIAANTSPRTIRLQLRTTTLTGLAVFLRTGSDTFWIRMDPGSTKQFQADLMEVFCEN